MAEECTTEELTLRCAAAKVEELRIMMMSRLGVYDIRRFQFSMGGKKLDFNTSFEDNGIEEGATIKFWLSGCRIQVLNPNRSVLTEIEVKPEDYVGRLKSDVVDALSQALGYAVNAARVNLWHRNECMVGKMTLKDAEVRDGSQIVISLTPSLDGEWNVTLASQSASQWPVSYYTLNINGSTGFGCFEWMDIYVSPAVPSEQVVFQAAFRYKWQSSYCLSCATHMLLRADYMTVAGEKDYFLAGFSTKILSFSHTLNQMASYITAHWPMKKWLQ